MVGVGDLVSRSRWRFFFPIGAAACGCITLRSNLVLAHWCCSVPLLIVIKICNNCSSQQQLTVSKHAQHLSSTSGAVQNSICTRHITQRQYKHTCSRQPSAAPPASTLIGTIASKKKSGCTAVVCTYLHV